MRFDEYVSWLGELSTPSRFESAKLKFLKHNTGPHSFIADEKLGIIKGKAFNPHTKELEPFKNLSFDKYLFNRTKKFTENPVIEIVEPIPSDRIEAKVADWLQVLKISSSIVGDKEYYSNFPKYQASIESLIISLTQLKKQLNTPSKRTSYKRGKAYELEKYLDLIISAGSHELAVKILKDNVEGFEWDRPNKSFFFNDVEGFNKTQVGHALVLIGKIKWPDGYPKISTIKKAFLDNR